MSEKRIEAKVMVKPHVWESILKIAETMKVKPDELAGDYILDGINADLTDHFESFTSTWREAVTEEIEDILRKGGEAE